MVLSCDFLMSWNLLISCSPLRRCARGPRDGSKDKFSFDIKSNYLPTNNPEIAFAFRGLVARMNILLILFFFVELASSMTIKSAFFKVMRHRQIARKATTHHRRPRKIIFV